MAIDTRQKRFSMMSFPLNVPSPVLFEADGTVDADDRAHLLGLYSGIALASPGGGPPLFWPEQLGFSSIGELY